MEDELRHYGVKGMKWGVRRTPEQLGHKVRQMRNMTDKERSAYAKERIKRRGAEQAVRDEDRRRTIRSYITAGIAAASHLGFGAATMTSLATGNLPTTIALGSAWVAGLGGSVAVGARGGRNASKNIQAISKESGLGDQLVEQYRKKNAGNKATSPSWQSQEIARQMHETSNQMHMQAVNQHQQMMEQTTFQQQTDQSLMITQDASMHAINMSTPMHMF